jgi:hypothetical protein
MPKVTNMTTERNYEIISCKLYIWKCVLKGTVEKTVMTIVIEAAMWHCIVPLDGSLYWLCLPAMWHCIVPLDGSLYWLCLPAMWHCIVPLKCSLTATVPPFTCSKCPIFFTTKCLSLHSFIKSNQLHCALSCSQ